MHRAAATDPKVHRAAATDLKVHRAAATDPVGQMNVGTTQHLKQCGPTEPVGIAQHLKLCGPTEPSR